MFTVYGEERAQKIVDEIICGERTAPMVLGYLVREYQELVDECDRLPYPSEEVCQKMDAVYDRMSYAMESILSSVM